MDSKVWQSSELVEKYLTGVRGSIPLASVQLDVMLRLLGNVAGVDNFLDLGSGDGILASAILAQYPKARGVLVDFSEPMLVQARKKLAGCEKLVFLKLDYGDPGWRKEVESYGPFSAIVSGFSIHHQPDRRKKELYLELYQLLAPGGMFVNNEHVSSASRLGETLFAEYFIDSLYNNQQGKSREQIAQEFYHRPDKEANILAPVEEQCRWLQEIGFQDVDCYFKIFELAVFAGRKPVTP